MSTGIGGNDDARKAEQDKKRAMKQVKDNANQVWIEFMLDMIWEVGLIKKWFSSDDVMAHYRSKPDPKPETHELRALGPVMLLAAKQGYCVKAAILPVPSRRRSKHASPVTIWASLIYEA